MVTHIASILTGFILDAVFGDPHFFPHPVRAIGWLINRLENGIRTLFPGTEKGELAGGAVFAVLVPAVTALAAALLLAAAKAAGDAVLFFAESVLVYFLLAARSLRDESMKVYHSLKKGDVEEARYNVSMIVGRDTSVLDEAGIARAAVETVAENTSDGVIAPLFFLALGGPVLGWAYKAVNTMDSMVGYKNEKYLFFGRAAARFDDLVNFIPARLSAVLMIGAALIGRMDFQNAVRIFRRDRFNHKSPNSAQTEAVCAGALCIRLAGDAWYFGELCKKPFIGDDIRPVEQDDIKKANRLMYTASGLALFLALAWQEVMVLY
ncbi:adenosylcobinamide-phosphate synthase CbiB [Clostridium transplantifaecale]|uniref:adenosylcobinamide-phosphate synthase CbiB n=1 Tax=Clostridium transplantifaecale TaxID=2479838 RepID=UPI000F63DED1|nr:adenosylcobinamide-phosphate synthase CbiB [Clostridium transplantifaecale]